MHSFSEQPIVGRRRQAHRRVVSVLEAGGLFNFREEAVPHAPHAAELPRLEHDQVPRHDGKDREDGQHELGFATGGKHELPRCRGNRPADL